MLALAGYAGTLFVSLTNSVVVGLGRMREFTIYCTTRGVVLATLCLLLIRPLGLEGAGWALLLTGVVDMVYLIIVLRRYLGIRPVVLFRVAYLKPIALGVVLAALAFVIRPLASSWIGLGTVGATLGLFYVAVGYWIGVFGETEKRALLCLWQMATARR